MSLIPPYRPFGMKVFNQLGRTLEQLGYPLPTLDEAKLLDQACKETGCSDFGDDGFREGLSVLLTSLKEEAKLNQIGRLTANATVYGYLRNRLHIHDYRKKNPDVAKGEIRGPLIVAGLPRTGTTILFNLLAQDPANRAPLGWEIELPYPAPTPETYWTDPRIAKNKKQLARFYQMLPAFSAIHKFDADLPQECVPIQGHDFMSVQFFKQFNVPSYEDWFGKNISRYSYEFHRFFLQHLQCHYHSDRWVLKSPGHLPLFEELIAAYPDACVIHTHRDPLKVMPSLASLTYVIRTFGTEEVDAALIGRQIVDIWESRLKRAMHAREKLQGQDNFFDVQFEDVVNDPIGLIGRIYDFFELPLSDEARTRMKAFLAASPRDKYGSHRYTLEDFSLDRKKEAPRFKDYCERFDIPENTTL